MGLRDRTFLALFDRIISHSQIEVSMIVTATTDPAKLIAEIKAHILTQLGSINDGCLVIETNDNSAAPLFYEAVRQMKNQFLYSDVVPVVKINPTFNIVKERITLSLALLALQEALSTFVSATDRDEMKSVLFDQASLVIRNSEPEIIKDSLDREFGTQIVEFFKKADTDEF